MEQYGAIVVGCGLAGCVIARHLAEKHNRKVLILERRDHIAGNMYDFLDENGVLVQKYGPHTFHTIDKELFDYMNLYEEWETFYLRCMACIEGKFTPTPFNFQTIDDYYPPEKAELLKSRISEYYGERKSVTIVELLSSNDELISEYAHFLFDKDYSLYTAKQWGILPAEIDKSVLKRVPVRLSYKDGYFDDAYQVMPKHSFTHFFENLLAHKNIDIQLRADAKKFLKIIHNAIYYKGEKCNIPVIYTGPIDELSNYSHGILPYRSLRFDFRVEMVDSFQDAPVVAYPQAEGYTRITEYTKLPVQRISGKTVIAVEYPLQYDPMKNAEPYYPILTEESERSYNVYREELNCVENLFLCGRLAEFKYYNMDQTLKRALLLCEELDEKLVKK